MSAKRLYPDLHSGLPSPESDRGLTGVREELFLPPVPGRRVCKMCNPALGVIDITCGLKFKPFPSRF